MSVFERMKDIGKATFYEHLERAEDPVALIDRYLSEQSVMIRRSEELLKQCKQHTNLMKRHYLEAESLKEKRERQAQLAVKAGEDQLARLALQEKIQFEQKSSQYQTLYEQGDKQVSDLELEMAELKADYEEVRGKRQYYMARLESVRLQRRMNERASRFGSGFGNRMFDRLEERINDLELETGAIREMRRAGKEAVYYAGTALQSVLDRELANLKSKLEREGRDES